jgi:hypothetical protein
MRFLKLVILSAACLVGCSKQVKTEFKKVNNINYFLIRHATTNSSGIVDIELWQKEGTDQKYTPSLTGNDMVRIM